jgi:hypothetical protein
MLTFEDDFRRSAGGRPGGARDHRVPYGRRHGGMSAADSSAILL